MNLRAGTRRLALLLGAMGAIIGGFASFAELKSVLKHNKFEALVESTPVQQEGERFRDDVQRERNNYFARKESLSSQVPAWTENESPEQSHRRTSLGANYVMAESANFNQAQERLTKIEHIHSELNRADIKTIHWTNEYAMDAIDESKPWPRHLGVESIETEDGQTLYQTPAPSAWTYLLITLLPLLGFFISWGAVRAIGWVGAGFIQSS